MEQKSRSGASFLMITPPYDVWYDGSIKLQFKPICQKYYWLLQLRKNSAGPLNLIPLVKPRREDANIFDLVMMLLLNCTFSPLSIAAT